MMRIYQYAKHTILSILLLTLLAALAMPASAYAQEAGPKTVRVGWFDSTFCYWDTYGRRCGIDYEYQHKISAYTGWNFEYVEDSWPNLLDMLTAGEIDLLSDVSYTEERTTQMSFPELPMGTEAYYIYIDADNREITAEDLSSFNGARIGVNKGSIQEGFLNDWAQKNHLSIEVVPLVVEESESMDMLAEGGIDGYASTNTFGAKEKVIPVCRVGASDFYYAVNKARPDLLADLNMALAAIQVEDPYFNERMSEEHLYTTETNAFLTASQEDWLTSHGAIRVGYRDNYLPFCSTDSNTGELVGALRDYLIHASNSLKNSDLRFEMTPYPSTGAALEAMRAGEVDCVFPVNVSSYEADEMDIRLTNPAMKTEMYAVMRESDQQGISPDNEITFAVNYGNINVETFIKDHYPAGSLAYCSDVGESFDAISSGKADCALTSNYRIHDMEESLEKSRLYSVPTGESMPLSFAVGHEARELYFIMNKTVILTGSQEMDSVLASYAHSSQKVSIIRFLRDHWLAVVSILTVLFAVILILLLQKLKAERKASEQQLLLEEAAEIAELKQTITSLLDNMPGMTFTKDAESGVYLACNQAYAEYAHRGSPAEVTGLTDAQLFDPEKAKHFAEDDRMALSMEEPYVFYDDEPDEDGDIRQIRTTRLKYTDEAGRLCVLGICQDVTNLIRIHRDAAPTREAYEEARSTGIIYTHIAQALARGYSDIYYVNLDTEQYIEYRTDEETGSLREERRGWHFFEECQVAAQEAIHPEDRDSVVKALDRKTLVAALDRNNTFIMTYRIMQNGGPLYVTMKISRMKDDDRYIVLGVTDVDEQTKQRRAAERIREEQIAYNRLSALTGDFLSVYIVVPETGRYREISANSVFDSVSRPREGMDFFGDSRRNGTIVIYPEDLNRFLSVMTRENVLAEIELHGIFMLSYRIMVDGSPLYVQLKAAMVEEKGGARLVVGLNNIDAQVRQEEEYVRHLAKAQIEANVDALTGVKNRHAYLMAEERLNLQLENHSSPEFAIVILDVNDLKKVNDTIGHNAGDQYLRDACKVICDIFKHSPVFRVGGDEFTIIAQGDDYADIEQLMQRMDDHNAEALRNGGIVIACGMARYEQDGSVAPVFERADHNMYDNKILLKKERK